jgi:hypothetical protein
MNKFNKGATPSHQRRISSGVNEKKRAPQHTRRSSQIIEEAENFVRMGRIADNAYNQSY